MYVYIYIYNGAHRKIMVNALMRTSHDHVDALMQRYVDARLQRYTHLVFMCVPFSSQEIPLEVTVIDLAGSSDQYAHMLGSFKCQVYQMLVLR